MRLALTLISLLASLSACTEFPALDGTVAPAQANGAYPDLVPLSPLLAQANTADIDAVPLDTAIAPRIDNLRARAARLRGPVIAPAARARLLRGVR